jgi:hypothetical protein
MAKKNDFTIINDLKTEASYLEILASAPLGNSEVARRLERAAKVMRKASRLLELEDDGYIPMFLRKQAR